MGVCGSSQICRSKDNTNSESNMHNKQRSLSSPHDVGFEIDERKKKITSSPSSQSLSSSDILQLPANPSNTSRNSNPSNSNHNESAGENIPKTNHPKLSNSRKSHKMGDTPSPNSAKHSLNKSRKSSNKIYRPLPDEENHDEQSSPNSCHVNDVDDDKPNNSKQTFVRHRKRASSQEVITAAEYALMEDSRTTAKMEDYTGLVTPLATPSTNLHNLTSATSPYHNMNDNKSGSNTGGNISGNTLLTSPNGYPLDFEQHPSKHQHHLSVDSASYRHREYGQRRGAHGASIMSGPLNNFSINSSSIKSVHSSSSMTATFNNNNNNNNNSNNNNKDNNNNNNNNQMIPSNNMDAIDNININTIYTVTREPNLSLSHLQPPLLLNNNGANGQFPRCSSTSSDFAHLLENMNTDYHRNSLHSRSMDNSDIINWRFSHGGSFGGSIPNLNANNKDNNNNNANNKDSSIAGSATYKELGGDSLSSIPIDRIANIPQSISHNNSLTDL